MKKAPSAQELRAFVKDLLASVGPYKAADEVGVTPMALVSFAHGYAKPHKKTIEAIAKAKATA